MLKWVTKIYLGGLARHIYSHLSKVYMWETLMC